MPLMNHLHDWMQTSSGFQCSQCTAVMTQPMIAQFAPNDVDAALADRGDDQTIWQQAWSQTSQTTT